MAKHVLVVEDEPDVLDALVQLLASAGFEVRGERDGLAGLRAFQEALRSVPFDLVMLDVMMPRIDGFTLCEAIRSSSDVPVMVITALDGEDDQLRAFRLLADDFVSKPFSLPVALERARALLRRSSARPAPADAALLIVAFSAAAAWACARLVARPVVEIADVSERLSRLDMTWSCDERRADEVGVLARSMNAMAVRLEHTIGELTRANGRLRAEAEEAAHRERERRDFLAAASHELKTPLAAARAQVEGMMLGIGDFADHGAHLPRALAALDRMDA